MLAHERLTAAAHKQNDQLIKAREAPGSVAQEVGNQMRRGEITPRQAQAAARKIAQPTKRREPSVEKHIRHLLAGIEKLLDPKFDKRAQKLNKIVEYRDNLSRELREDFSRVLAALADRVVQFRNVLRPEDPADARLSSGPAC